MPECKEKLSWNGWSAIIVANSLPKQNDRADSQKLKLNHGICAHRGNSYQQAGPTTATRAATAEGALTTCAEAPGGNLPVSSLLPLNRRGTVAEFLITGPHIVAISRVFVCCFLVPSTPVFGPFDVRCLCWSTLQVRCFEVTKQCLDFSLLVAALQLLRRG